jgi:hypothetical protein
MVGTRNPNFSEMEIQVLLDEVEKMIYNLLKADKSCHKQQNSEGLIDSLMFSF